MIPYYGVLSAPFKAFESKRLLHLDSNRFESKRLLRSTYLTETLSETISEKVLLTDT